LSAPSHTILGTNDTGNNGTGSNSTTRKVGKGAYWC